MEDHVGVTKIAANDQGQSRFFPPLTPVASPRPPHRIVCLTPGRKAPDAPESDL
jgi:hypothetical protein